MNRHSQPIAQATRPAYRRIHRRPSSPMAYCPHPSAPFERRAFPAVSFSSPSGEIGRFELLAAELRIAELENELAAARQASHTDPLTGALNRRGFDEACARELSRAQRRGAGFALAHIDLDDFKQLNDTFGHHAGDLALIRLVEVLRSSLRPTDVLCRFGGEEFVLLLPETSLADATLVVSRFLREFSSAAIAGTGRVLTFSAGVVFRAPDESTEQAIQRADAATYAAKRSGKNCVVTGE